MKQGTKSLLFGPKSILIRPFYVIKAWEYIYGPIQNKKEKLIIFLQYIGYWGKDITPETEYERILIAEKIAKKLENSHKIRVRYPNKNLEQVLEILPEYLNVIKIRENPKELITELTVLKTERKIRDIISGSHELRAKEQLVQYSELYIANSRSIEIMPRKLLKVLTLLSKDPEGQKELALK